MLDALEPPYLTYQDIEEQYEHEADLPVQQEQVQVKSFYNIQDQCSEENLFDRIFGHENLKGLFLRAISSDESIHILLTGSPGTSKTLFLIELERSFGDAYYFDCANASGAGLIEYLFEHPNLGYVLCDEIDKLKRNEQNVLLNLMENNVLTSTKIKSSRTLVMEGVKVFATCNNIEKIIKPLQSRFLIMQMKEYSYNEFLEISAKLLSKYNHDELTAKTIANHVWNDLASKDIRDVIKAGRIIRDAQDIHWYVSTMKQYSKA